MPVSRIGSMGGRLLPLVALALLASSCTMIGWGWNELGQVGAFSDEARHTAPLASSPNILTEGWETVAPGSAHTCAITNGGQLWCWGDNTYGQLGQDDTATYDHRVRVGTASNWQRLTSGDFFSCALKGNSAPFDAFCWGRNNDGQLGLGDLVDRASPTQIPAQSEVAGFMVIDAGDRHTCAHGRGTLDFFQCWGDNADGQLGLGPGSATNVLSPLTPIVGPVQSPMVIGAGGAHTCVYLTLLGESSPTMQCMGENSDGQLGDGTTIDRPSPVEVTPTRSTEIGPVSVLPTHIASGTDHTCVAGIDSVLGVANSISCVGRNHRGQLGDGTTVDRTNWLEVETIGILAAEPVTSLTSGTWHTCVSVPYSYDESGLWCWGANNLGQAGVGAPTSVSTPTQVFTRTVGEVGSQDASTCATVALRVECFGFNGAGGLGDGTTNNSDVPVPIEPLVAVLDLEVASGCQIRVDESLWCWGYNVDGQLGLGDQNQREGPTRVTGASATDLATGATFVCYLDLNGDLRCAGAGFGNTFVPAATGAIQVDAGVQIYDPFDTPTLDEEICGVSDTNGIACGPPGGIFTAVDAALDWASISTSSSHRCAIKLNGTLWCTGENDHGQLGLGDTTDRSSIVQVGVDADWTVVDTQANPTDALGTDHEGITCATKIDGTLWCWGFGGDGQLGLGADLGDKLVPTQVGVATDWDMVSLGADHACGVRGVDAYCWGDNGEGQLGDGSMTAANAPVAASTSRFDVFTVSAGWEVTIASTEFR